MSPASPQFFLFIFSTGGSIFAYDVQQNHGEGGDIGSPCPFPSEGGSIFCIKPVEYQRQSSSSLLDPPEAAPGLTPPPLACFDGLSNKNMKAITNAVMTTRTSATGIKIAQPLHFFFWESGRSPFPSATEDPGIIVIPMFLLCWMRNLGRLDARNNGMLMDLIHHHHGSRKKTCEKTEEMRPPHTPAASIQIPVLFLNHGGGALMQQLQRRDVPKETIHRQHIRNDVSSSTEPETIKRKCGTGIIFHLPIM